MQSSMEVAMSRSAEDDALIGLARLVVGISTRAADRLGRISVVQLRALTVLRELGTASLAELADGVGVTPSTTSRLVDRLVVGGWADRQTSPESRRQLALRLTAAGEAALADYDRLRLEELHACLDRLPRERRAAVVTAFAEFSAVGNGAGRPPAPRRRAEPADGGDPACWLHRVCPACGRLADDDPPTRCPACGEPF
jgi:DNA-binding MarR family transcriptional regulator